jgi:hypothetical protein
MTATLLTSAASTLFSSFSSSYFFDNRPGSVDFDDEKHFEP